MGQSLFNTCNLCNEISNQFWRRIAKGPRGKIEINHPQSSETTPSFRILLHFIWNYRQVSVGVVYTTLFSSQIIYGIVMLYPKFGCGLYSAFFSPSQIIHFTLYISKLRKPSSSDVDIYLSIAIRFFQKSFIAHHTINYLVFSLHSTRGQNFFG